MIVNSTTLTVHQETVGLKKKFLKKITVNVKSPYHPSSKLKLINSWNNLERETKGTYSSGSERKCYWKAAISFL